jgi:hypothetical protein
VSLVRGTRALDPRGARAQAASLRRGRGRRSTGRRRGCSRGPQIPQTTVGMAGALLQQRRIVSERGLPVAEGEPFRRPPLDLPDGPAARPRDRIHMPGTMSLQPCSRSPGWSRHPPRERLTGRSLCAIDLRIGVDDWLYLVADLGKRLPFSLRPKRFQLATRKGAAP